MKTLLFAAFTTLSLSAISCGIPETTSDAPTTACADIAGAWNFHRLQAWSDGRGNWAHSTDIINNDCTSDQVSFLDSAGNTSPGAPVTYTLSPNGILTRADNPSYQAMVMRNNQMIVVTRAADNGQAFRLAIAFKKGGAFSQADLAGTHIAHLLRAGAAPLWSHGTVTVDGAGNASALWTASDGTTSPGVPSTQTVSSSGAVTDSLNATWRGMISGGKALLVATATVGSSFDLIVAAPRGSETFTTADLAGTWRWHRLQTGIGHAAWARGIQQSDSAGNVTPLSQEESGGNSNPGSAFTWTINAAGVITRSDRPEYHGVMLPDKNTIISTRSSGDGLGYRLSIARRE